MPDPQAKGGGQEAGINGDTLDRPPGLDRRANGLLLLLLVLVLASAAYLLYARGFFEPTQRLVLVADDSEGVIVGMDLSFSGFPIGRVQRIELTDTGQARLLLDIPRRDAHWLRTSSVFTLTRGLVGNTSLRAYSGVLSDPPLPNGAERRVLLGDATSEIPQLVGQVRSLVTNLTSLTAGDSALAGTLAQTQALTQRLNEPGGALGVLFGNPGDAQKLLKALDRTNQLLLRLDGLAGQAGGLVTRADSVLADAQQQVLGPQGLARDVQSSVKEAQALLADTRRSLQRVDQVLQEAQGIAKNVNGATQDLEALRADLEGSLRQVDSLVNDLQRRWPFKRDAEIRLP
jgi:phospholipid/cholesterol/gamma-HCH transport system substrate-binding protein